MIGKVEAKGIEREVDRISLDVMIEILSRLPVKSLVRFRLVCKLWLSITHDPHFIDAHLELSRNPPSILLFYPRVKRNSWGTAILDHAGVPKRPLSSIPNKDKDFRQRSYCNESCNGLLCISETYHGTIQLVNPATREFLTAPEPTKRGSFIRSAYLGFHPVTKEYKVIRFFCNGDGSTGCEVYTLGTSSWRQICTLDYYPWSRAATVKGVLYWAAHPSSWPSQKEPVPYIVAFDLKDEKFTRISPPNLEIYRGTRYLIGEDLVELQGNVCICISIFTDALWSKTKPERRMDIWMLNDDHSTKHEWTQKYSLNFPHRAWARSDQICPLLTHKDKILVHETYRGWDGYESDVYEGLLRYHHLKSESRCKNVFHEDRYFIPFVHVDSLVPLRNR